MGSSCGSSILDSIDNGTGGDSTTDGSSGGDGSTTTPKGVPEGVYAGSELAVESLDNVNDAYPATTYRSTAMAAFTFGSDGRLLRSNGTSVGLGDFESFTSRFGTVTEQITAVNLSTNVTEYRTQAGMVMAGEAGLSWTFSGTGVHTFRLTGGNVVEDSRVEMNSDTVGGAAYQLIIEFSATLTE